ncbi:MAG TPA: ribonuclease PH [Bacillota bacterium]|nr:ribonuclease PH [Bacillota bacterium]
MSRHDGREINQLRDIRMTLNFIKHAEGSVLIEIGDTKVICNASIEDRVPPFLRGQGKAWITAEYAMLPRATERRNIRESSRGKVGGRTMEIQRLIGRSLRAAVDLEKLGERTIWIDCDVIQADGGTRTASITGAFVALVLALNTLKNDEKIDELPIKHFISAISVGVLENDLVVLDLDYEEDFSAKVDMNIIMNDNNEYIEIQGNGEEATFSPDQLQRMLSLATEGTKQLFDKQKEVLGDMLSNNEAVTDEESDVEEL